MSNDLESRVKDTAEDCVEWCRNVTECRTVDYILSMGYCSLRNKTALDVASYDWVTGDSDTNLYQKMCA